MAPPGSAAPTRSVIRCWSLWTSPKRSPSGSSVGNYYAYLFGAPNYAEVFPGESLSSVVDDELRERLRPIGHKLLFSCKVTVTVSVVVQINAIIRHVGNLVSLVVVKNVRFFSALLCTIKNKKSGLRSSILIKIV